MPANVVTNGIRIHACHNQRRTLELKVAPILKHRMAAQNTDMVPLLWLKQVSTIAHKLLPALMSFLTDISFLYSAVIVELLFKQRDVRVHLVFYFQLNVDAMRVRCNSKRNLRSSITLSRNILQKWAEFFLHSIETVSVMQLLSKNKNTMPLPLSG